MRSVFFYVQVFSTGFLGYTSCVSNTPLTDGIFQLRLSGAHEARRRFALTGEEFFAEIQRRGFAAPRGGGKRVDTYGFYPLNSRFPLFLSLAQIADM